MSLLNPPPKSIQTKTSLPSGLRIVPATRSFVVLPGNASRVQAVESILASTKDKPYDFVLAIGNDERLLARLNVIPAAETISTGTKSSDAKWKLERSNVFRLLRDFASSGRHD